ncbi:MAG TPA: circadian clock KaiB family protein [Methylomirabilota bacterium]
MGRAIDDSYDVTEGAPAYQLHLFVTGASPRSLAAVAGVKALCEELLPGRYDLVVTDVYQEPELARRQHLVVTPTFVKHAPPPVRSLVGDVTNRGRLIAALGLSPEP